MREVGSYLTGQFRFNARIAEKAQQLCEQAAKMDHDWVSSASKRSTRLDIRFHRSVSSFKAFWPDFVIA